MIKKLILAIILLLILTACQEQTPRVEIVDKAVVFVEIADDPGERQQGLMNREHLDYNAGMLFIFEKEQTVAFWMKNTLIPLDMIFINKDSEIVDIQTAVPCKEDPCKLYKSQGLYVLEVNAGFSEEKGIKAGDTVEFFIDS